MNDKDLLNAKSEELKGKIVIFMRVSYQNQCRITLKWVNTSRMISSEKIKSCLVVRGFKENQEVSWTYSPNAKEIFIVDRVIRPAPPPPPQSFLISLPF